MDCNPSIYTYDSRGVVQLFNAVRKQQKTVEEEVQKAGSDRKKEKVMEKITKNKFLSMLKGSSVSNVEMGQKQESLEKVCYILEVAYNVSNMIYQ